MIKMKKIKIIREEYPNIKIDRKKFNPKEFIQQANKVRKIFLDEEKEKNRLSQHGQFSVGC
jgi:hypothetical protein